MTHEELLERVTVDPNVCGGRPYVRSTRIDIAIIMDAQCNAVVKPHRVRVRRFYVVGKE